MAANRHDPIQMQSINAGVNPITDFDHEKKTKSDSKKMVLTEAQLVRREAQTS